MYKMASILTQIGLCVLTMCACAHAPSASKSAEATAQVQPAQPKSIESLDVKRYMGQWYEIGRLPMFFQRQCAENTTATYTLKTDSIEVLNRCVAKSGKRISALGRATKTNHPAQLKVTFAPDWINWLSMTQANYWVLKLDANYQYALVGTPDKKYLWLLSRTPVMPNEVYHDYLTAAKAQGYDLSQWMKTKQINKTKRMN